MTHYFDQVQFFADVCAHATREGHGPMEIEKQTGLDHSHARKVWQQHEFTLFYQGTIHAIVRLAVYADLNIDNYIKEMTWTQKKARRRSGYRRLKSGSSRKSHEVTSATDAQAG